MAQDRARLWGQFVERAAEHFRGQLVRKRDVVQGHGDVFERAAAELVAPFRALVLVKERYCIDERQVFLVVAPVAGASAGKVSDGA